MGRGGDLMHDAAAGAEAGPPMSREKRRMSLGVDCAEILEWRGWEAGGEYQKDLLVKNTSTKAMKLKYQLPATKYFSMEFPEAIRLAPGMSAGYPSPPGGVELGRHQTQGALGDPEGGGLCLFVPGWSARLGGPRARPPHKLGFCEVLLVGQVRRTVHTPRTMTWDLLVLGRLLRRTKKGASGQRGNIHSSTGQSPRGGCPLPCRPTRRTTLCPFLW